MLRIGTPRRRAAFSLIELLLVLVIIALLAGLLLPCLRLVRDAARASRCATNMRQISIAMLQFANDNQGMMVGYGFNQSGYYSTWSSLLNTEVLSEEKYRLPGPGETGTSLLVCPVFSSPANGWWRCYNYNLNAHNGGIQVVPPGRQHENYAAWTSYFLGAPHARFGKPATTVMVQEAAPRDNWDCCSDSSWLGFQHSGGRSGNVIFMDGRVDGITKDEAKSLRYGF